MVKWWFTALLTLTLFCCGQSANIVIYMVLGSPSHKFTYVPYANALAKRGHQVTIISSFPGSGKELFEDIAPVAAQQNMQEIVSDLKVFANRVEGGLMKAVTLLPWWSVESCSVVLRSPEMVPLVTGLRRMDLLVVDPLANECALGLAHVHSAPHIYFSTTGMYSWQTGSFGLPASYLFSPSPLLPGTSSGTFWGRLKAAVVELVWAKVRSWYIFARSRSLWEQRLQRPFPDFEEMERNTSLVLVNSHHAVEYPLPYFANMVHVGGIHLKPSKPLPKDLEEIVQGSGDDGFIIFGLGSVARAKDMPPEYFQRFLEAFRNLPQRIFWKWESDTPEDSLPPNVFVRKWLPQNDLLGHPKCKAFVTHGGKLSTMEAMQHGVPVLVIPFFADQDIHAQLAQKEGFGIYLDVSDLTADTFRSSLEALVSDPSYRQKARQRSKLLRDQMDSPLDRAIFWTELVLKHKGLPHLRPDARNFTWYQYHLVDVWAFLLVLMGVVLSAAIFFLRFVCRSLFGKKNCGKNKKKVKSS